jgi:hypothetical protein
MRPRKALILNHAAFEPDVSLERLSESPETAAQQIVSPLQGCDADG